jgi:hypothetical protein
MLSDTARARLDITDGELDARYRVCESILRHASLTMSVSGRLNWKAIMANQSFYPAHARSDLAKTHELLSMYSGFWGFIIAALALIANPQFVDANQTQRAGEKRSVGSKTVPFLEHRRRETSADTPSDSRAGGSRDGGAVEAEASRGRRPLANVSSTW